jgi:SHS2 domain-containing protein
MTYRWAEHTAEVELEIEAPAEEAVFTEALHALAELLGDGVRGERVLCAVAVTGGERAVLLA